MAGPTARVLRLLSLLQTHVHWRGADLAERLEVSPRTLRRDVDRLRELGYPVEAVPGVDGGYRLAAGAHLPPLLLDDDEAVAIAVALRTAAGAALGGLEEVTVGAMAKVEQLLPDRLRRRVAAVGSQVAVLGWSGPGPAVDTEVLAALAGACRDSEEVRFAYRRRDGEQSRRLVRPHQLVTAGRSWYLVAWDVRRDDWRTFRLDRLTELRLAGARFARQELPAADAAAFVAEAIRSMPRPFEASLAIRGRAVEVVDLAPWLEGDTVEVDAERCGVRLRGESVERLAATVALLATRFELTVDDGPPELTAALARVGRRLHRCDDDAPPNGPGVGA